MHFKELIRILPWSGLVWPGLARSGLVWPGLAWSVPGGPQNPEFTGLASVGLARRARNYLKITSWADFAGKWSKQLIWTIEICISEALARPGQNPN